MLWLTYVKAAHVDSEEICCLNRHVEEGNEIHSHKPQMAKRIVSVLLELSQTLCFQLMIYGLSRDGNVLHCENVTHRNADWDGDARRGEINDERISDCWRRWRVKDKSTDSL